jgi:hypothetical protein
MLLIENAGVCFPHSTQNKGMLAFRTEIFIEYSKTKHRKRKCHV